MNNQKLLTAYDPDMAYPLINQIEYPYSISAAWKYFREMDVKFMHGHRDISELIRLKRKEKEERLTRYNFIKDETIL